MSIAAAVYDAFAAQLANFASSLSPPVPVLYPGVNAVPPDDGTWLEASYFPNETVNYGTPDNGPFLYQGILQVSVCERPGSGIVDGLSIADAVVAAFKKGTVIGPASIQREPWVSNVLIEDDRLMFPVSIPYRAFLNNA